MASHVKSMTSGSPGKLIMTFAIPLMLGNVFQQFYTMVDTMVVGQVVGVKALAALGAADWLVWLVLGLVSGMTQGFSILVSQYYGAQDGEGLKKSIALSYVWTAVLAAGVLAVSQLTVYRVMIFLNTPADVIDMSMTYLRIVFCGIPVIAAYNIFASVLRAMGNSRSPLIAMIVAAAINVALDLLFVAKFHWGVAGAAIATVIAQAFSAVYCYIVLRKIDLIRLEKKHFRPEGGMSAKLWKIGVPLAVQNVIISIGGLTVQYVVNGFGFLFVAGFTATNKMYGVLELAAISYGYSITTYVGQNLGAGKIKRIRQGVKSGAVMALVTSIVVAAIMILAGKPILSLFISGEPEQVSQVLAIAYKYLFIMAAFLWVLYLLYVYRSALQGLGNTVIPLASGIAEFVMRVLVALLLPKLIGQNGIFYAEIFAWTGAAVLLMVSYFWVMKKSYGKDI
ncbi:MAG: MATE family efflux transporter [Clostridiales bacterium]|nr:MATE family efflux transporter [Clostridiales bacterium]